MGEVLKSCSNCVGSTMEICHSYYGEEVRTISIVHALEADEQATVQADPTIPVEQKEAIREAGELESVHLTDYRAEVLADELAGIGCELSTEQIKENLIVRVLEA